MKNNLKNLIASFCVLVTFAGVSAMAQTKKDSKPASSSNSSGGIPISVTVTEWVIVGMNGDVPTLKAKFKPGQIPLTTANSSQIDQITKQFAGKISHGTKAVVWGFNWQAKVGGKVTETGGPVWVKALIGEEETKDVNIYQPTQKEAEKASDAFNDAKAAEIKKKLESDTNSGF